MARIIDQFGLKRCQMKRKDVDYKLLLEFFKNVLLYISSRLSKIRSVHTYVMPRTVYFGWICRWFYPFWTFYLIWNICYLNFWLVNNGILSLIFYCDTFKAAILPLLLNFSSYVKKNFLLLQSVKSSHGTEKLFISKDLTGHRGKRYAVRVGKNP